MQKTNSKLETLGFILVLLMTLLQGAYGIFAYLDPSSFSSVRGTELFSQMDADWVNIYASRTIFITLILGFLLYTRNFSILMWCALFGIVMPVTDAILAYQASAPVSLVLKHIATVLYLLATYFVLKKIVAND